MSTLSSAAIAPGKLAVGTGGASVIGLAAARAVGAHRMRIAIFDRPGDALEAAVSSIKGVLVNNPPARWIEVSSSLIS